MLALLSVNSFAFPFLHKIGGGMDVLSCVIVIFYFVFFSDVKEGNNPAVLTNPRNLHYRHKFFQEAPKSKIVHSPYGLFFNLFLLFSLWEKKEGTLLTVAMNSENLYYCSALQAVH